METAICFSTQSLPAAAADGAVPEWIHVLPAGTFEGVDGRGPFTVEDYDKLIAASMPGGRKLPIDENHSIDLVGTEGQPAPARGWIVELQKRDDGLWARVEWTKAGRELIADRAYGFNSPVFLHSLSEPHKIHQLLRVALCNDPNLTSLKSLHGRTTPMDPELLALLGLEVGADNAAVMTAVTALNTRAEAADTELATIRTALGIDKNGDLVKTLNARLTEKQGDDGATVDALQQQITALNTQLTTLTTTTAREKAEELVDKAIADTKILPTLRDHYIARHMKDPADVEKEIGSMVSINAGGLGGKTVTDDKKSITGTDHTVCQMMGLDPKAFAETSDKLKETL